MQASDLGGLSVLVADELRFEGFIDEARAAYQPSRVGTFLAQI